MTVYCPNCGKPNTDEAHACASCGTQLTKPGARKAGKFKGTMMMAGVTAPTPPAAGPGAPPSGDAPQQPAKKDLAFQQTMLGPMTPPPGQPGAPQGGGASGGGFGAAGGDGAPGSAPGGSAPGGSAPGGGFGAPPSGSAPGGSAPGGGFGEPPSGSAPGGSAPGGSAPGGGFGAPPSGSAPGGSAPGGSAPGGGFGAPPGGSAPGGGFGPPPGGSAPGGGFGAPPGGSAPGGGFGAPPGGSAPGGSAPGGGFGAPPGGSAPGGPPPGGFGGSPAGPGGPPGGGSKAKLWLGIGIGCLLISILGCVGGWYYCKSKAEQFTQEMAEAGGGGGNLAAEISRIGLTFALGGIQASCRADPSGAGANNFFHPQVAGQYGAAACQATDQTVQAFSNSCSSGQRPCSNATVAAGTADESRATALGLDPQRCYVYTSGSAKVVACQMDDGLKFVHIESLGAVQ